MTYIYFLKTTAKIRDLNLIAFIPIVLTGNIDYLFIPIWYCIYSIEKVALDLKTRIKVICSSVITFVMLFVFSLHPHASYASEETQYKPDTNVKVEDSNNHTADEPVTEPVTESPGDPTAEPVPLPPMDPEDPQGVLPLLAPVAVAGLSWTIIDSIFCCKPWLVCGYCGARHVQRLCQ